MTSGLGDAADRWLAAGTALPGIQVEGLEVDHAVRVIRDLGVGLTICHVDWGHFQPRLGSWDFSKLEWWERVREVLGALPQRAYTLYPVHMNERGKLPDELQAESFSSPRLRAAFEEYVGKLAEKAWQYDAEPIVIIGNEVDIFADSHPEQMGEVIEFLNWAAGAVHRVAPHAQVCHPCTADVLDKPTGPALVNALAEGADLLGFTLYGMGPDQRISGEPAETRVCGLEKLAAGRPIVIVEIARPSGAGSGSSEELQADYVDEMFDVLAARSRADLRGAIWLTTTDWPVEPMREWVHNQMPFFDGNEPFLSFLTSNGVSDESGHPKAAYRRWVEQVSRPRVAAAVE